MSLSTKQTRRNSEVFGLSFLDVICCGFGAMVLLVLLSKTDIVGAALDADLLQSLLQDISAQQKSKTTAQQEQQRLRTQARQLEAQSKAIPPPNSKQANLAQLQQRLAEQQAKAQILKTQTNTPAQNEVPNTANTDEVVQVGGIPVDSNYIIFIVDTSGSMDKIWERVIDELENVLDIHPKVDGFQIMNDNGAYLISSYAGKWIPDTPSRRKSVLGLMKTWSSFSNSSPVEGLQKALKTYAARTEKLAIYIFGDDYTGGSYDTDLDAIAKLNLDSKTGQPRARIHGIGFLPATGGIADRFATLMREVTRRNRGAFVGLAEKERISIVEADRRVSN